MQELSAEQLAELRQTFEQVDSDGDGKIGEREFVALLQSVDEELSRDECLLAFQASDTDGDGAIGFEEFLEWWTGE